MSRASSCASVRLEKPPHLGTGACSALCAWHLVSLNLIFKGLVLNSSLAVSVTCEILAAKLQGGRRHVESVYYIYIYIYSVF